MCNWASKKSIRAFSMFDWMWFEQMRWHQRGNSCLKARAHKRTLECCCITAREDVYSVDSNLLEYLRPKMCVCSIIVAPWSEEEKEEEEKISQSLDQTVRNLQFGFSSPRRKEGRGRINKEITIVKKISRLTKHFLFCREEKQFNRHFPTRLKMKVRKFINWIYT